MKETKKTLLDRQMELDKLYFEKAVEILNKKDKEGKIDLITLTNVENLRKQNIKSIFETNIYLSDKEMKLETKQN